MVLTFKSINTGSIAAGSYAEVIWTPDTDIRIKAMVLNERSNASLNNVQVYITIADVPYTRDFVPASTIGTNLEYCWKPDLAVPKGARIYAKLQNSGSSAVNIDVVFLYE
jgi:hypothetical protein